MWAVEGKPKDQGLFGEFLPKDVLIWYDGPRTFTLEDADGGMCLAHWLDEDSETLRYAVVPVVPKLMDQLQRGELSLREILDQPRVYVVDQDNRGEVRRVWLTRLADLPQDVLPTPGTMLHRNLETPQAAEFVADVRKWESRLGPELIRKLVVEMYGT